MKIMFIFGVTTIVFFSVAAGRYSLMHKTTPTWYLLVLFLIEIIYLILRNEKEN